MQTIILTRTRVILYFIIVRFTFVIVFRIVIIIVHCSVVGFLLFGRRRQRLQKV